MRLRRLLRTTAVRLALRYALIYAAVFAVALAMLEWRERSRVDPAVGNALARRLEALREAQKTGGQDALARRLQEIEKEADAIDRINLLLAPDDRRLAGTLSAWPTAESIPLDGIARPRLIEEELVPHELSDDDVFGPVVAWKFSDGTRVLLAHRDQSAEQLLEFIEYLRDVLGVALLLALVMSLSYSNNILRRMDQIGRTAAEIANGDLAMRVAGSGHDDEFDILAARLNTMLDRIQQLVRGMREVTDSVTHDLRSPLARLRSRLEVVLLEPRDGEEYREAIGHSVEDLEQLIRTFNALLGIAQAEAGTARQGWQRFDLDALVNDVFELFEPLAEQKGQAFEYHRAGPQWFHGSRELIAQAIGNLMDNAIKYTPPSGQILIRMQALGNRLEVAVIDSGPGIAPTDHARVFERFVRLDHSRNTAGNGLGLSLVQVVARLHGADLALRAASPGLIVTLGFPRAPDR